MRRPTRLALAGLAVSVLALTGCSTDPLAEQFQSGDNKRYIAGDGTYTEIPPSDRDAPITFTAELEDGSSVSSEDLAGDVTVVNFWYAGCAPCRAEAPDLESLYQEYRDDGVSFLGVNTRDQPATARSFAERWGTTYPSVIDVQDSTVQLAFSGSYAPNATPTTFVLDRQGRIASRILGEVDRGVLDTLVADTLAEAS
ncbi:TlpA family protein disulfide reductase [Planctomonas psychrotolerans]|uniref:TlpA family protein disulfide reductase n=1 Tax=Planctomonas psychrotolerans TaxID=2528712 RepID=UPI00123C1D2D|nr:TlpA disulfide reductase family protein [Planctomonas psychrotolerans]